jgi:hypothetical protein
MHNYVAGIFININIYSPLTQPMIASTKKPIHHCDDAERITSAARARPFHFQADDLSSVRATTHRSQVSIAMGRFLRTVCSMRVRTAPLYSSISANKKKKQNQSSFF